MIGAEPAPSLLSDGHLTEDAVLRFLAGNLRAASLQAAELHLQECVECLELLAAAENPAASLLPPSSELEVGDGAQWAGAFPRVRRQPLRRIGQYELYDCLGEGGMGIVFRAWATQDQRWVALKQVRLPRPAAIGSVRREIHALGRVNHPGVVRVFEQGTDDGLPWYAMELIEGDTLNARIRALPGTGLRTFRAVIPVLRIVRRLCHTLAFLHGEGIVHQDLAPKNVILQHRDTPVLVDFGLAWLLPQVGREGVDLVEGGTPFYMAPEQIDHGLVDARADLYALGCMLYEIFTGNTPFAKQSASSPAELLRAIAAAPAPPPPVLPGLPPALQTITMQLLARRPGDRCGYALDVAHTLERAGVDDHFRWNETAPRPYLYRPGLVARARTIEKVEGAVARCARGVGGCAMIAGESGMGKTRVLLAAAAQARAQRLRVVTAACPPPAAGPSGAEDPPPALGAFRPLLQVIADSCRQGGPGMRERLLGGRTQILSTFEPALRELRGIAAKSSPELDSAPAPAEAVRFRLFEAMRDSLRAFAQVGTPLVLIIDDLHWLDDLSRAFVERLDREFLEQNAILLLGSYRSEEVNPGLRRHLGQVGYSEELTRLGGDDVARMVADMLAVPTFTPELIASLARLSEGNPYFVTEYVRMAVEGGWLARAAGSPWLLTPRGQAALARAERLPTPTSLATVLAERLRHLPQPAQQLAQFAAVLGSRFTLDELQRGLGLPDSAVLEAVSEMLRRQILASADDMLEFAHDRLRQAAHASVPAAALANLHRTAALILEAGPNPGERLGDLAHHWQQAGELDKERQYRGPAGERAFRVGAYADAITHLERALALRSPADDLAETTRLQRHLAEAHFGAGDMVASRRRIESLAAGAGLPMPAGPWSAALTALGDVAGALVRHGLGPVVHTRSPARRTLLAEVARAYERLAHVMYFENELIGVTVSSLRALGAASRLGPSPELARVYGNLSISAALIPQRDLARAMTKHARQIATEIGDVPALIWTQQLEGVYLAGLGEFAAARDCLKQAMDAWHRMGDRRRWEETLTLLGMCLYQAGRFSDAAQMREQLERAGRDSGSPQTVGWALIGRAEDLLARGEVDGAIPLLERAQALGPFVRRVEQMWMNALMARACHLRGEEDRAYRAAEEARPLLARFVPTAFYTLEGHAALVEVYLALATRSIGPDRDVFMGYARQANRALARFARVFPFAEGRCRLWRGMLLAADGRVSAARGVWTEAASWSEQGGRPFDAALLWQALARFPESGEQPDHHALRQVTVCMDRALAKSPPAPRPGQSGNR